jgi:hypothetical protein
MPLRKSYGNNQEYVIQPAGTVITANGQSPDLDNSGAGVKLVIDITAVAGTTPTLTFVIEYKDPASGKYIPLLTSAALGAVATTELFIYPGAAVVANLSASNILPKTWRVRWTIGGTGGPSITASIGAVLLPS